MTVKDLYPALRAHLLADATLSAAVGGARIHIDELPQGQTADSIALQEISAVPDHHNQGPSGLARPRVQITSWSRDRDAARTLARLVKTRLDGFGPGVMGSGDDEIVVKGVFFESSRGLKDDTAQLFGYAQDYFINFWER